MLNLSASVSSLPTVTAKLLKKLKHLKLQTVSDLIFYYPWRYDDFSKVYPIKNLVQGHRVTVRGKIEQIVSRRSLSRRQLIVEALIADATGQLRVVWFNQAFLVKTIQVGDELCLAGKVETDRYGLVLISPVYERARGDSQNVHTARLVPIYTVTSGLTNKQLRFLISRALAALPQVREWLPDFILNQYQALGIRESIKNIHFPASDLLLEQAKERLKFDELFFLQLSALLAAREIRSATAPSIIFKENEIKNFVKELPFKLTDDQRRAAWEILKDLGNSRPTNRLLEGDVGSGKTVVVAITLLNTALNGFQTALLAPTEILARQHFQTLAKLFKDRGVSLALFTSSDHRSVGEDGEIKSLAKKELINLIKSGEVDVTLGTHALLEGNIIFKNLALCAVDEQHRFGVSQRQSIKEKGPQNSTPHFLSLSATPIPRSLALTIYGDLDLSLLKEMPPGRQAIMTRLVAPANRFKAYNFIRAQVKAGRQVFVICPLIEKPEAGQLQNLALFNERKAVTEEYTKLKNEVWPDLRIAMLHGKMKPAEKEKIMRDFADRQCDVLVSTSVVEVGIDVPNATVMLIEGAESFGLAQLHQFRGRVGRGEHQSYCFLFSESLSDKARRRLDVFVNTNDGFALAEKDLALRGPGQVYGTIQSGFPELRFASLDDIDLIKKARSAAASVLERDPDLIQFPEILFKLQEWDRQTHLE